MIKEEKNALSDPEIRDALNAMQRAALLARETAIQTNTAIIIIKDGKQVRVTADELRKQQATGA